MKRLIKNHGALQWFDLSKPTNEELQEISRQFSIPESFLKMSTSPTRMPQYDMHENLSFFLFRIFDKSSKLTNDGIFELTRKISVYSDSRFLITIHGMEPSEVDEIYKIGIETFTQESHQALNTSQLFARLFQQGLRTFYVGLETIENDLEVLEAKLFKNKLGPSGLRHLQLHRRRLSVIKRLFFHSQDLIMQISSDFEHDRAHIQDLKETLQHLTFVSDELLEETTTLLSLEISMASQRTSEVVRVLTIFSVFFMPLTFIVGVYGMNFEFMPELNWQYGYAFVWGLMAAVTILIGVWFQKNGWLDGLLTSLSKEK